MFVQEHFERLQDFSRLSAQAGARADYVQGGGGNTSVKLSGGLMAIKASGYSLKDVKPDAAYAVLDYESLRAFYNSHEPDRLEDVEKSGSAAAKAVTKRVEGLPELRPSVEAGFHSLLSDFVLHTHSVYANMAACCDQSHAIMEAAFADAHYGYANVAYVDPGAGLTFAVRDALKRTNAPAILLMQNHGLIAHHDDMRVCLDIHADANARIARQFGISAESFPGVSLKKTEAGFISDTPFLIESLKSGAYSEEFLLRQPLYPDQLVFLNGTLTFGGEPAEGMCSLQPDSGMVRYRMDEPRARVIEETLTAVAFIVEHIRRRGYTLRAMGEAAKAFIANWESEQYRKSLSGGKKG